MNRVALAPFTFAMVALAVALATAPRAASQEVPSSPLATSWWVGTRSPYVVGKLTFAQDDVVAGAFDVSGVVMVRAPIRVSNEEGCQPVEMFDVAPIDDTTLSFGPRGQLRGTLGLTSRDAESPCTGTLRIVRGKDRVAFPRDKNGVINTSKPVRRLTLRGRLTIGNTTLRRTVRLRGVNLSGADATNLSRWTGESTDARVRGRAIASNKFGVRLDADPLGFPFLDLDASGAVRLDGVRQEGLVLTGTVAVAQNRWGLVRIDSAETSAADLGSGWGRSRHYIASRFATNPHGPLVFVHARMTATNETTRRIVISGQLD